MQGKSRIGEKFGKIIAVTYVKEIGEVGSNGKGTLFSKWQPE